VLRQQEFGRFNARKSYSEEITSAPTRDIGAQFCSEVVENGAPDRMKLGTLTSLLSRMFLTAASNHWLSVSFRGRARAIRAARARGPDGNTESGERHRRGLAFLSHLLKYHV
jgi:hypothetical protein